MVVNKAAAAAMAEVPMAVMVVATRDTVRPFS